MALFERSLVAIANQPTPFIQMIGQSWIKKQGMDKSKVDMKCFSCFALYPAEERESFWGKEILFHGAKI